MRDFKKPAAEVDLTEILPIVAERGLGREVAALVAEVVAPEPLRQQARTMLQLALAAYDR